MQITVGLFDHMVLQRDARGVARATASGQTDAVGAVHATVRQGQRRVGKAGDVVVGTARGGGFVARLPALPTGGPYSIELKVIDRAGSKADSCIVRDVLVGDVWIAAGQSNMQGCGHLNHPLKPLPRVRAFYMDDRWAVAADPIHSMWEAVDPAHALLNGGSNPPKPAANWGTCPAVAYAQALYAESGVPQGILACAHGGTSMSQWDPAAADTQGNRCLYGALRRRLQKNGGRGPG
jgi:sialate O-acetylesterase